MSGRRSETAKHREYREPIENDVKQLDEMILSAFTKIEKQ